MPDFVQPTPTAAASSTVQGGKYVDNRVSRKKLYAKNMAKWCQGSNCLQLNLKMGLITGLTFRDAGSSKGKKFFRDTLICNLNSECQPTGTVRQDFDFCVKKQGIIIFMQAKTYPLTGLC